MLLEKFDRAVTWALAAVRGICIVQAAGIFLVVIVAVVARYVFGKAVSWTEEVPRYLLIWISFLAGAAGVARRDHVGFDVLFYAFPERIRRILGAAIGLLLLGFGWNMFRYGIVYVQDFGDDLMETIPFTNSWYYMALPISGALFMLFSVKIIVDSLLGRGESNIGSSVD
ncbi:MAG: TRAP transporter small permease [Proteobacteria bacterium]|nr:TRAP transporter small permease [Pseudomonadota bacterium]